jgi:hypothetical protein
VCPRLFTPERALEDAREVAGCHPFAGVGAGYSPRVTLTDANR